MSRVVRIDEVLRSINKPVMHPIDELSIDGNFIIVACAGFEDRSVAFLNWAISTYKSISRAIFIEYRPFLHQNQLEQLISSCETSGVPYTIIQHDRDEQSGTGDCIVQATEGHVGPIIVDISGMSRHLIVQTVVALGRRKHGFRDAFIGYTEAEIYPPSLEEFSKAFGNSQYGDDSDVYFLSSGVHEVSIVPELSSVALQGQPIRLIFFPSFNPDQLRALRSVIQPSFISVIHGEPPSPSNKWRLDAISTLNGISCLLHKEEYTVSTFEHNDTVNILLDIYQQYGNLQKLVIAPTGSKMQSVAVGIVRTFLNDIQIAYPTTRLFSNPSDYTRGVKKLYMLSLAYYSEKIPL